MSGGRHQGEEKRQADHGEKTQLAEQSDDRAKERNDRQVSHQQREQGRQRDRLQIQIEAGDQFAAQTLHPHFAECLEDFFGLGEEDGRREDPDEKQHQQLESDQPPDRLLRDHPVG